MTEADEQFAGANEQLTDTGASEGRDLSDARDALQTLRDQVADQVAAAIDGCGIPLVYRRQVKATVLLALAAVPALSGDSGPGLRKALREAYTLLVSAEPTLIRDAETGPNETSLHYKRLLRDRVTAWLAPYRDHFDEGVAALAAAPVPSSGPEIVVLCGSTRFYDDFQQANYDLTMAGKIVLSVGFYPHSKAEHGHGEGVGHDSAQKVALDELHKRKIDLADWVYVLNRDGYIGDSTRSEIDYALAHDKPVRYRFDADGVGSLDGWPRVPTRTGHQPMNDCDCVPGHCRALDRIDAALAQRAPERSDVAAALLRLYDAAEARPEIRAAIQPFLAEMGEQG